jgi:hypothetical protein
MITVRELSAKWKGHDEYVSDGGARNVGRLVARKRRRHTAFLFRYFDDSGRKRWLPLGQYDEKGSRGLSLPQAREAAAKYSAVYVSGVRNLHQYFRDQLAKVEAARGVEGEAARLAAEEALHGTLGNLLNAYVENLELCKKSSARDVKSIFNRHVFEAAPKLVLIKAKDVGVDELVRVISGVVEKGYGRTAAKLRSYMHAAYATAIGAKTDPAAPEKFRNFGIVLNPLSSIDALSKFNRRRTRNLNLPELAAFLKRIGLLKDDAKKHALEACVDLGGQRPVQMLRARVADLDIPGRTITLYDRKGARSEPRVHVVPLTDRAVAVFERRINAIRASLEEANRKGKSIGVAPLEVGSMPLFSLDGRTAMREETISEVTKMISSEMVKAGEAREPFQLRDIRRTVETMLAGL